MTLITPVGGNSFNWAPQKSGFTKQASSGASENTGKDALFEAAKKVVAQFELDKQPCDAPPCDSAVVGASSDPVMPDAAPAAPDAMGAPKEDAVKVVSDLVEKCDKAEQVSTAVQDAVGKVEVALQGVKDAVGVSEVATDEAEVEVEVEGSPEAEGAPEAEDEVEVDEVEIEFEEGDEEGGESDLPPGNLEGEGDEIVKEGDDEEAEDDGKENPFEKSAAGKGTFVKVSEISPENRKKVYSYWHDMLGYPEDFCKLMVKNYEK